MKTLRFVVFAFIATMQLRAAPPSCKTEKKGEPGNEITLESCQRDDFCDDATIKEQIQNPSNLWMGCMWPALITSSLSRIAIGTGMWSFATHLTLVARYRDSERMDVTTTFELKDHTFRKDVQKDVPIIIRDDLPQVTILVASGMNGVGYNMGTIGVPTVEAVEKGGKKSAVHSYR
jgi:hypothetical protein